MFVNITKLFSLITLAEILLHYLLYRAMMAYFSNCAQYSQNSQSSLRKYSFFNAFPSKISNIGQHRNKIGYFRKVIFFFNFWREIIRELLR